MQSVIQPARDVFTRSTSELVSSLVVVPLVPAHHGGGDGGGGGAAGSCLGALYFTHDAPCDWDNVQEPLLVGWGRPRTSLFVVLLTLTQSVHSFLVAWRARVPRPRPPHPCPHPHHGPTRTHPPRASSTG